MTDTTAPAKSATGLIQRVTRGVAWLDANVPGWVDKVEVMKLEMDSACFCVLGQVFSNESTYDVTGSPFDDTGYDIGLDLACETEVEAHMGISRWAIDHGFDSVELRDGRILDFDALGEIWVDVIEARKAAR